MIIDTHSHLNFNAFKNDLDEVIRRTLSQDIWLINVGSKYETSKRAMEIAEKYKQGVFASVGIHPIYSATEFVKIKTDPDEGDFKVGEEDFNPVRNHARPAFSGASEGPKGRTISNGVNKEKYKELAKSKKVVAIGEIGLDYYYKPKTKNKLEKFKEKQKEVFKQQLELARELNLPVILHCRMAHDDLLNIISNFQFLISNKFPISNFQLRGVIHCFTGTVAEMEEYLKLGLYIGFNGIIFKLDLNEVIKKCPLEKILVETDCPYLTPIQEGNKRNEPIFIKYIIEKIANLKRISFSEVVDKTTQNALKLFRSIVIDKIK